MPATKGKPVEPTTCNICGFSSKRITIVEKHIIDAHGLTAQEAFDAEHGKTTCKCGCGNPTKWINYKVGYSTLMKGHNARIHDVYDAETATKLAATRGKNWRGGSWSKGLTKETDERVAARAASTSEGRKKAAAEGKLHAWSKGLTKETDERVAKMAMTMSLSHKTASLRTRLDELKRLSMDEIKQRVEFNGHLTLLEIDGYVNNKVQNLHVKCNSCGSTSYASLKELQNNRCYNCDPVGSTAQVQISSYIKSLGFEVKDNVRDVIVGDKRGLELDILVPSKNFAIEYNGLYWHCALRKSDTYHQNKTLLCNERGVKLFHVFQDEWIERVEIVKAMIRNSLGLSTRIGARDCKVVKVDGDERRKFFETNHLDGDVPATHAIGLEHDGDIVMMISLRRPFHKKHATSLEVARLASKKDVNIVGGLSRLSKHAYEFASSHGSSHLLTYVDNRLGSSSSWEKSGWQVIGETAPRFWWTDFVSRFNRFKFKADKSRGMSEMEVAAEAKVVKIYCCSNTTLTYAPK